MLASLASLASLVPLLVPAVPLPPVQGEPDIAADLEEVQKLVKHKRWSKARDAMFTLFDNQRGRPELRTRWVELESLLTQIDFWGSLDDLPEPQDVIEGDLLSFSESSGKVKIKYRTKNGFEPPWDFIVEEGVWIHPAVFAGRYKLRVKGTPSRADPPFLVACWDQRGNAFGGVLGGHSYLLRFEDGEWETLEYSGDTVRKDRWYEVSVLDGRVVFSNNNKDLFHTDKPKGLWGSVGFFGFSEVEECEITGELEPAWIEGRLDALLQDARAEFTESYDVMDGLPQWLIDELGTYAEPEDRAPGAQHASNAEHLERLAELKTVADYKELVEYAEDLGSSRATDTMRDWLLATGHWGAGSHKKASKYAAQVLADDPEFYPADELLAWIAFTDDPKKGIVALEQLGHDHPDRADPIAILSRANLWQGDVEAAREVVAEAIEGGISPLAFRDVQELHVRADLGPTWGDTTERRTRNFVIRSDLDDKVVFEAGEILEESYAKWNIHLKRIEHPPEFRYKVFLFSGNRGYLDYAGDVLGSAPESTLGVFSPLLKQLLIWNSPEREMMFKTIRHEGFHQYFDALIPVDIPRWLNEGLAEYYESTELVRGRWKDGALNETHLANLRRKQLLGLDELAHMEAGDFYTDPALTYGQSWAFCHFLMADKDRRKALDALIDALVAGQSKDEALIQLGDLKALDGAFRAYVRELGR